MLRIKLRVSNFFMPTGCYLCGRGFTFNGIQNNLYEDDECIGDVCDICMKRGSEHFPCVLRAHAEHLRKSAEELEQMADEGIAFPTDEEIVCAIKEREEWDSDIDEETRRRCAKSNTSRDETWIQKASKLIQSRET
jgi:hypothetical protein